MLIKTVEELESEASERVSTLQSRLDLSTSNSKVSALNLKISKNFVVIQVFLKQFKYSKFTEKKVLCFIRF